MKNRSNQFKGIVFLVVAAFGFAFMSLCVKLSKEYGDPIPTAQMVLFRNSISMVFALALIMYNKSSILGNKGNVKWLILRSSLGTIGMLLFFYSIVRLPLGDANMLNKLSTFFLILFSSIFLKEKVKLYQILAILMAFLGSLLIIKPTFSIEVIPYITSVLAAVFAGGAYTVLRVLGRKEKYYTVVFFFSTFSVLVLLPYVLLFDHVSMTSMQVLFLVLAGVGATVGQFGTTIAYKYAPANEISIFNYTNVIFASLFGVFVFSEIPDTLSLIGYITIFIGSFIIFIGKKPV